MYIYVIVQEKDKYYSDNLVANCARVKMRIEQASGERCLVVPFEEMDMKAVKELNPRAVAVSGFGQNFQKFNIESFFGLDEIFHEIEIPLIGFCGGHQLMGFSLNNNLRQTERLYDEPMKKYTAPEGGPYYAFEGSLFFQASGFFPIKKIQDDPLFDDLPEAMLMCCSHYCEVKKLPEGFEILATSEHCRIEAMKHVSRPLYGTQFHPEAYAEPFFDGRALLKNFAKIVDGFWSAKVK